jgi:hypothetical protein
LSEPTFLILAIFAPPLPNTLPTALAGINISRVDGGGILHDKGTTKTQVQLTI